MNTVKHQDKAIKQASHWLQHAASFGSENYIYFLINREEWATETEGVGDRDWWRLRWSERTVCLSLPLSPLACTRCLASSVISFHNRHCHPCISIFTAAGATLSAWVCVCVFFARGTALIMQGLGKTERGDQGRDIDLTSLRSTMPAGGPLQVSAPRKMRMKIRLRGEFIWGEFDMCGKTLTLSLPSLSPPLHSLSLSPSHVSLLLSLPCLLSTLLLRS